MTHRLRCLHAVIITAISIVIVIGFAFHDEKTASNGQTLPVKPDGYLGVYVPSSPTSVAGLTVFSTQSKTSPNIVVYYSGWLEPFQSNFAEKIATRGAIPLVQIDPQDVNLATIAHGKYDTYLTSYAKTVHAFSRPVIVSFGHEMNGNWFSWGNGHETPANFVAAWRHIVTVFRSNGAVNITWLWTINTLAGEPGPAAEPLPWWPGASYVTWVGMDGYFYYPNESFNNLFKKTLTVIHRFTDDPVLITETGISPAAGQTATISRLFAGVRSAGVLGVVYFNANGNQDWRLDNNQTALATFGRAAYKF